MSKRSFAFLTAFMLAILAIQSSFPPAADAQSTSTWTTQLTSAASGSRYGYSHNSYGAVTDRDFVYGGHTYVLYSIRWRQSKERVELYFDDCIKASEFVSLKLGSSTYSNPDWIDESDERCAGNRNRFQTFHFYDATTNPMPAGQTISVQITARGNIAPPPAPTNTANWDATIGSRKDNNADHYGYEHNDFGTITDRTFDVSGHTFEIDSIKWDESDEDVELRLNDCLKPKEFVSLRLGTTTFSGPDYTFKTSSYCNNNRDTYQLFRFDDVSTNPLPSGRRVSVRITYSGDAALPANTATRWSTYLDSIQDNNDDEYGYHASDFGSIDDRTFDFGGTSYTIRYLKWEDASNDVQFYLNECLKKTEVKSLVLGSRTFSAPNTASRTDATCGSHRSYDQILKWTNVTSNPLPAGQRLSVTLNFASATPASLPTVAAPSQPALGTVTTTSIGVSWGAVTGAGSYQVRYKRVSASAWSGPYSVSSGRSYTASALPPGTEYEFQVRATGNGTTRNSSTWSSWSTSRKATTTSAPGAPTNGSATVDAFDGSLDLSWTAPSSGASTYQVNIRSGSFSFSKTSIAGTSLSIPGTSLSAISGLQTARVKACNSGGNCGLELSISFRPPAPAPSNLRGTGTTTDSVTLTWGSVTGITGYEHDYRKASDTTWSDVDRSTTATSRTVGGLECGVEYVFRVRSAGDGTKYFRQWGPWSNEARATTAGNCIPSAPQNVGLTAGNRQITVSWDAPASNGGATISSYRVRYMADDESSWTYSYAGLPDPLRHVITGLENGTSYEVEVQARNSDAVYGAWSEAETETPVAPAPLPTVAAPSVTTATNGVAMDGITIQWPAVSGATKYQVQQKLSANNWPTVDDNAAGQGTLLFAATGLTAATSYDFRVRAYGNGTTRSASWGPWSGTLSASTLADVCTIEILEAIANTVTRQGSWSSQCASNNRYGRYAKHFSFTVGTASTVTIELVSSTDPYLYLMSGEGTSGKVVARNDDSRDNELGRFNSRIIYEAAAGQYTAEATTFRAGAVGDFTIRIIIAAPTNAPPAFGAESYSFSVDEDEANGHTVGTVAATDSDGTVASYSLDDTTLFNISNTGVISVAASLEGQGDEPPTSLTVTATDDDGDTDTATVEITVDDVLPSEPRNVVLTPGHALIGVSWTAPELDGGADIDGYRVRHRAKNASAWSHSRIITASPYTIEGLDNGTTYQVEVQARNSLQQPELGHWSDFESATPVASTLPVADSPTAPTKTVTTSSSIAVSWGAVTGATRYRVRYKTGNNDWNVIEVATGTKYTASMLDAAASYRFEVSALGNGTTHRPAWGAWSAHLDAATNAAPVVSGCTTTLGSITGESNHAGSWTDECVSSNRPATRFARYYTFELVGAGELDTAADLTIELVSSQDTYLYLMNGAGTSGTEVASNDNSRDDDLGYYNSRITYVASAGTYTIEATTQDPRATGDFTIRIDAALRSPSPPLNVRVIPGNNRLVVLWDPPASDGGSKIAGYRISQVEMSGSSGSGSRRRRAVADPSRLLGADARGYTITNLDNGTEYSVTVKAANKNSDGASSTATGTPQAGAISIGAVKPNPLVLARKATVKVTTSNLVSGGDYSAELVIADTDKIRFGNCGDDRATQPLPNLGSIVKIQACETGTPTISARLLIGDNANRKHILAESLPRRVTVSAAPEALAIEGLDGDNSVISLRGNENFTVDASHLTVGEKHKVRVTTSEASKQGLGFNSDCSDVTDEGDIIPTAMKKSASFVVWGCDPTDSATVTAQLILRDVVVAVAIQTVGVKPAVPSKPQALGHTPQGSSGRITLRVEDPGLVMRYNVRYRLCAPTDTDPVCVDRPSSWTATYKRKTATPKSFTVNGQLIKVHEIVLDTVSVGNLYRVEIAAVFENDSRLTSGYTDDAILVYPTKIPTKPKANGKNSVVASVGQAGFVSSKSYTPRICQDTFPADTRYVQLVEDGIDSWKEPLGWVVETSGGNSSRIFTFGTTVKEDCNFAGGFPSYTDQAGDWDITMVRNQSDFNALCNPNHYACARVGTYAPLKTGEMRRISSAPIYLRHTNLHQNWLSGGACKELEDTAAHEVGHVVGLSHRQTTPSTEALMGSGREDCAPQPLDIVAALSLYQSR